MAFDTKIKIDDQHVIQGTGTTLTLNSGSTTQYNAHPTFTQDTQLVDKKYVDDNIVSGVTGGTIYNLDAPSTITVGGLVVGATLTGCSSNCILQDILTPYISPAFSSFGSTDLTPTTVEVGCVLTGNQTFCWTFSNETNVEAGTMCIIDVTDSNAAIATDISITSPSAGIDIGTVTFSSCPQTQDWKGCAENSCTTSFGSSNHTITSYYPYYWGICTCPGAAGAGRPTLSAGDITGGTKVLNNSAGSIAIDFDSGDDDYLWFAVPSTVTDKVCWYVDIINQGLIGDPVSPGGYLFAGADTVVGVENACWSGVSYDVYVSNKQTSQTLSMTIS